MAQGTCYFCEQKMVAKCGEIVAWHWAHSPRRRCDPWWETETEWHRKWKNYFPERCQLDEETGEKHIADIKTDRGVIIELQHSSIKPGELRSREQFYDSMIWVVDGRPFKNNFHILSRLPHPESELASKLRIMRTPRFPLDSKHPEYEITNLPIFLLDSDEIRRSDNFVVYEVMQRSGDPRTGYNRACDTECEIESEYKGHHFIEWRRPRSVWLSTQKPVFIDFGDGLLWHLSQFQDKYLCARAYYTSDFVEMYGGTMGTRS